MAGAVKWRDRGMGLEMPSNARTVRIEWGDCDPAGIVFYPRYFAMFDHSTTLLIERTLGLSKHQLYESYAFAGYPVVETRARFLLPSAFGDDVVLELRPHSPAPQGWRLGGRGVRDAGVGGTRPGPAGSPQGPADTAGTRCAAHGRLMQPRRDG
jgi:acyl-CoA thioesterase FadM